MQRSSNIQHTSLIFALLFSFAGLFTSCQKENINDVAQATSVAELGGTVDRNTSIYDIAASNPNFTALVAAVQKTNLVNVLRTQSLTVLAPTNTAFARLDPPFNNAQNINAITNPAQISALSNILRYHVIAGRRQAAQLPVPSIASLADASGPNDNLLWISRPTVSGTQSNIFVNGNTRITTRDIFASNGTIQVIDNVLIPASQTTFQIAQSNPAFSILTAALARTGLFSLVNDPSVNLTVFAPTNAAFAQLPAPLNSAEGIRSIRDQATLDLLRNVLLYHVVPNRVFSVDLSEGLRPGTALTNRSFLVSLSNGPSVTGDGNSTPSRISTVNLLTRNGVIHIIDQVLLP